MIDYADHIKALVDQAPPLTAEQSARLRQLLAPARRAAPTRVVTRL